MSVFVLVLLSGAATASAQTVEEGPEPFVVLTGALNVPADSVVDDAVIFNGDAVIDGRVDGNVFAFNGDVTVNGTVTGNANAVNGRVTISPSGAVEGDVLSRLEPRIEGRLGGSVQQSGVRTDDLVFGRIWFWIAASISSLLFGLLWLGFFPKSGEALATAARTAIGGSIGFGLLLFVGIPLIGGFMLVTIVGGLFGVALLLGMVFLYSVAYAAGALALGRLLLKPPRKVILAFLLGWVILRVLALVPVLGGFLFVVTAIWGFGAIAVAARRAGRPDSDVAAAEPVPAGATPPMPPMP